MVYVLWVLATYTPVKLGFLPNPEEPQNPRVVWVAEWQTYEIPETGDASQSCQYLAATYIDRGFQAFCQKDHR